MRRILGFVTALLCVGPSFAADPLPRLKLDPAGLTVSGISSGGYMAVQYHVAHSRSVAGAGIVSAGPWYCAQASIARALGESVYSARSCSPARANVPRTGSPGPRMENRA